MGKWTGTGKKPGAEQRRDLILAVAVILAFLLFRQFFQTTPAFLQFSDDGMTLTCQSDPELTVEVRYADILSVSQADCLDLGTNLSGVCTDSGWFGVWENDDYGTYTLCADPSISAFVVLDTAQGVVVCNYKSLDATDSLYTALRDYLDE